MNELVITLFALVAGYVVYRVGYMRGYDTGVREEQDKITQRHNRMKRFSERE